MTTPPRFIAEVSSNHHRELDRCQKFVDVAAEIGCHAVKFQQFKVRKLFAREALRAKPKLLERQEWELPESYNAEIAAHCAERGVQFSSTPFYLRAVDLLEPLVDFFKVASYQVLWSELLREVGKTGKPVQLATGMATMDEVRDAVEQLTTAGAPSVELLHCVSVYPTPAEEANLAAIQSLRSEFGGRVGWSDHSRSPEVVRRAIHRWEATTVEFHLDLEGKGEEYSAGHCWLPEEIQVVIEEVARGEEPPADAKTGFHVADGMGVKRPRAAEELERCWRTDPSDGLRPLLETRRALAENAA